MLELNQLYNMDCMEGMALFPDGHFDLAVVDVPYGINVDTDGIGTSNKAKVTQYPVKAWDKDPPPPEYFAELMRVSKNQVIWGANHFISRIPYDAPCWIVWDKDNGSADFADCELAWTSFKTSVKQFTFRWSGMLQGNMKKKEKRIHPTQKPVALYDWIYHRFAKDGFKIIDTHAGSASSFIAAYNAGLDYIGFEIDRDYYSAAKERIDAAMSQIRFSDLNIERGGGDIQLQFAENTFI